MDMKFLINGEAELNYRMKLTPEKVSLKKQK